MTWTDNRTRHTADTERAERAHAPEIGRHEDAEPDEPFTMPAVDIDPDYPPLRAFLRLFQEWT